MKHLFVPLGFLVASCLLPAQDLSAFGNGEGVTGEVRALVVQKDGQIVIGGTFTAVNGVPRQNLARLTADGTVAKAGKESDTLSGKVSALGTGREGAVFAAGTFSCPGQNAHGILQLSH